MKELLLTCRACALEWAPPTVTQDTACPRCGAVDNYSMAIPRGPQIITTIAKTRPSPPPQVITTVEKSPPALPRCMREPMYRTAPRRPLNPKLFYEASRSGINHKVLAQRAGFPSYNQYWGALNALIIVATPRTVERLLKVAFLVGLPSHELFLDEPSPLAAEPSPLAAEQAR